MFEAEGLTPNIAMSTNYLETIKMMVSIGWPGACCRGPCSTTRWCACRYRTSSSAASSATSCTERTLSNAARAFMRLLDEQAFGNGTPAA